MTSNSKETDRSNFVFIHWCLIGLFIAVILLAWAAGSRQQAIEALQKQLRRATTQTQQPTVRVKGNNDVRMPIPEARERRRAHGS